jgi:hypothetical protein
MTKKRRHDQGEEHLSFHRVINVYAYEPDKLNKIRHSCHSPQSL